MFGSMVGPFSVAELGKETAEDEAQQAVDGPAVSTGTNYESGSKKDRPKPRRVKRWVRQQIPRSIMRLLGRAADGGRRQCACAEAVKYDPTTFKAGETRTVRLRALVGTQKRSRQRLPPSARPPATCSPSIPTLTTPTSRTFPELTTGLLHQQVGRRAATLRCSRRRATSRGLDSTTSKGAVERSGPVANLPLEKKADAESENRKTESGKPETESENRKTDKTENRIRKTQNSGSPAQQPVGSNSPPSSSRSHLSRSLAIRLQSRPGSTESCRSLARMAYPTSKAKMG